METSATAALGATTIHTPMNERRLLRARQAWQYLGIGRTVFYRKVRAGELPPPVRDAGCVPRWPIEDLDAYADRLIAERDAAV